MFVCVCCSDFRSRSELFLRSFDCYLSTRDDADTMLNKYLIRCCLITRDVSNIRFRSQFGRIMYLFKYLNVFCLCVSVYVCMCLRLSVCVCVCLSVCLCVSVSVSVSQFQWSDAATQPNPSPAVFVCWCVSQSDAVIMDQCAGTCYTRDLMT